MGQTQTGGDDKKGLKAEPRNVRAPKRWNQGEAVAKQFLGRVKEFGERSLCVRSVNVQRADGIKG